MDDIEPELVEEASPPEAASAAVMAYSYLRFSTPEQMKGDSLRRQTALASRYVAAHGLRLDEKLTFQDLGVSAFRGKNAEAGKLAYFLEAVRSGLVQRGSYLLVESLDRISRQAARRALRVLEEIVDEGITLVTLNDGKMYTAENLDGDPMSLMMALLTFIRANEESATKSRRLKAAWGNMRRQALQRPLTSIVPAWMARNGDHIRLIEERAAVVRRIVDMMLAGMGQHRIAETLNREGVPLFGGGAMWHRSYVKKISENPALVGTLVPHEIEYVDGKRTRRPLAAVPGYYPAIVSEAEWGELMALSQKRRPQQRAAGVQNILAGLAKCASCGGSMGRVQKGRKTRPVLVCSRAKQGAGCEYRTIPMSDIEWSVRSYLPGLPDSYPTGDDKVDELAEKIRRAEAGLQHIVDELAEHGRSSALTAARLEQEAELAELGRQMDEAVAASRVRTTGRPERLGELVDADVGAVNTALRTLYKRVVVSGGGVAGALSLTFEPV
jgi:DNA invertase Pin-like site-specific DNA recombinase